MAPVGMPDSARRVVVKIGSNLLVNSENGQLRFDWLKGLAADVAFELASGREVILVSSGSIALGRSVLGFPQDESLALEQSQAAAAVGQIRLAQAYEEALAPHDIVAAQVLLTLDDSDNRRRFLNSRATINALLGYHVVPIVNENDTIATDEIRFGDNDRLSAQVASMAGADVLILLSDVDGLYTGDPKVHPNARRVDVVREITPEIESMAGDAGSLASRGGMKTKLMAAGTAMRAGCAMVITSGNVNRPIEAVRKGANCTWFLSEDDPRTARKQWIAAMRPRGWLHIDAGAERALQSGKSLLPAGVVDVTGTFGRGDAVAVRNVKGHDIARGLASYSSQDARLIVGLRSHEIELTLGYPARAALVHRDDLVL